MTRDERFDAKWTPDPNTGCYLWTGATSGGYGRFYDGHGIAQAHRFAYERRYSRIPEGLEIDHLCRVRCCVNPDHLEVVTSRENSRRGLLGLKRSKETCERISRAKKGTVPSIEARRRMSESRKGLIPWNKGLSVDSDDRVRRMVGKSAETRTGMRGWSLGLTSGTDERVARSSESRTGQKWSRDRVEARRELTVNRKRDELGKFRGE